MPDDPVAGAKAPATNSTGSHQNAWILQPPWRAVSALSETVWKNSYQNTTFSVAVQTPQIKFISAEACAAQRRVHYRSHPFAKLKVQRPASAKEWGTHFFVKDTKIVKRGPPAIVFLL
jgi:hypothetical protein